MSSFWGSTQIAYAIVILTSLKKIKRPHFLPSALSRAAYLPSAVLRLCLFWEQANLSLTSSFKLVPGMCSTRKYLFVYVFVHFLVTMSFIWWRKIKCYSCFQQSIKTISRRICLSPWHKSLKGHNAPEGSIWICN